MVQEIISPSDYIIKLYSKFGKIFVNYSNTLDLEKCADFEILDVKKYLKDVLKVDSSEILEIMPLFNFLVAQLRKQRLDNYGMDIVYKKGSNDLYIIDLNEDNFGWSKLNTGFTDIEFYRSNLIDLSRE